MTGRGKKTIGSGERTIILNVLNFFELEKREKSFIISLDQAVNRTCVATGISKRSIMRIKNEAKQLASKPPAPETSATHGEELCSSKIKLKKGVTKPNVKIEKKSTAGSNNSVTHLKKKVENVNQLEEKNVDDKNQQKFYELVVIKEEIVTNDEENN